LVFLRAFAEGNFGNFPPMPTKPATKKPISSKGKVTKPVPKNTAQKKPEPDKGDGLSVLKQVLHLSPAQKRPAPDKVEHLVRDYLAKLREADVSFESAVAVIEKYRNKYPELSSHIRCIVQEERRIEITHNLSEDAEPGVRIFVIRILNDGAQYAVTLSGDEEQKTVKPSEWLSLLHDTLARIIARILYSRETSPRA
jgi:hypothetical protein